jgi:two-component system, cell cycle sensor histidine kinase and response regulator CckA
MAAHLVPLLAGPLILIPLALYAFARRSVRGAVWYGILLLSIAIWSLAYAWELADPDLATKLVALRLKYIGILAMPVAWLGFILCLVGSRAISIRRTMTALTVVALGWLIVAWTDHRHHFFWGTLAAQPVDGLMVLTGRGPGFWINVAYTYAVLIAGAAVLIWHAIQSPYLYRRRATILIAAALLPWIGNVVFVWNHEQEILVDPTPLLFSCTAVLAAVAVFRYRVLDPIPTLRDLRIAMMGDALILLDAERRVVDLNQAAELVLQRRRADTTGTVIDDLVPDWPADARSEHRQDFVVDGPEEPQIFDLRATAVVDADGHRTATVVLLRDVTLRRHAETALADSERRYRDLVENAPDPIVTIDLEGRVVAVNRAGLRLFGYTSAEVLGRQVVEFVAPQSRSLAETLLRETGAGAATRREELLVRARDGRSLSLEVSGWLQHRDGLPIAIQVFARDMTERQRLEAQLRQSQKMEAVEQLAGGIAHDFNNLLTGIMGFAGLAAESLPAGNPAQAWLLQIRRSADQAASLTQQLLAFGRGQILRPVGLDLNRVIAELEPMLRRLIGEDVALKVVPDANLQLLNADRAQIHQVILNLVINARDAMPGGGTVTVRTRNALVDESLSTTPLARRTGAYVVLEVSDSGEGMDAGVMSRIFEPFFSTKDHGRGTGLGLSTVYGIVTQSGGDISVQSRLGGGSTFTVHLPAANTVAARDELPPTAAVAPAGAASRASVLLVEDDQAVRDFSAEVLRRAGHEVSTAASPADALAMVAARPSAPDLLITDIAMPGMHGAELADRIQARFPALRVLFISGYTDQDIGARGILVNGRRFLAKPFKPAELRLAVREMLDQPAPLGRQVEGV